MSKPRPPIVNADALAGGRDDISALAARLRQYEALRNQGEITTSFIAFEAIAALMGGIAEGYSEDEIAKAWPREVWGTDTVSVPAALLRQIAQCWIKYRDPENESTLGEVFRVEGRGAGSHRAASIQRTRDKSRRLANLAIVKYLAEGASKEPLSVEAACAHVAEQEGVKSGTVEKAWKKYKPEIWPQLIEMGLISEG
ncbi:hypothetical protein [Roseivivax sediminis]|uniref:hypothetical protein n=1 Tax=Roseivivax sediminis TaxID=936889 RepID=UPI00122C83BE|nr:hypothetical protein [Roseivivax sediminis]